MKPRNLLLRTLDAVASFFGYEPKKEAVEPSTATEPPPDPSVNPKGLPVVIFSDSLLEIENDKELFEYARQLPQNQETWPDKETADLECRVWVDQAIPVINDEDGPWWGESHLVINYHHTDEIEFLWLGVVSESTEIKQAQI